MQVEGTRLGQEKGSELNITCSVLSPVHIASFQSLLRPLFCV